MGHGRLLAGFFLLFVATLSAQDVEPASVFLDSSPLGARIEIDGKLLTERTPLLLRGLADGQHTATLWKDGYLEATRTFRTGEGKVPVVQATLPPESVGLAFPENEELGSGSTRVPTAGRQFRYLAGTYHLSGSDDAARLNPVFADIALLDTAGWGASLATLGALASGGLDALNWSNGGPDRPSALSAAWGVVAVGEVVWFAALQNHKSQFYRERAPEITPLPQRLEQAGALATEGEDALQSGDLSAAEARFRQLTKLFPHSSKVPWAWFRLAKIHSVTGRQDLALGEYRLVAETYPQAATHDRARQALADLYEAAGRPDLALYHLDRMVLADGFFDPEAVGEQRARLADATVSETPAEGTETPTAMQAYDRALGLFGLGHPFTAEELASLSTLQQSLADSEPELAADLEWIQVAVAAAQPAAGNQELDREAWEQRQILDRDRQSWLGIRNGSLALFQTAAASTILAASLYERDHSEVALWSAGGSAAVMALSLFPLLWGEGRQ